ncbi:MAG: hypothetical protein JWM21_2857 [Acidobacteria bacterium]|nr:hypothetical protein [Acidobacteriota bacterium]
MKLLPTRSFVALPPASAVRRCLTDASPKSSEAALLFAASPLTSLIQAGAVRRTVAESYRTGRRPGREKRLLLALMFQRVGHPALSLNRALYQRVFHEIKDSQLVF